MASKHSPSTLSSGLVMGSNFLLKFHEELIKAGGGETFLHFMTTKRGQSALQAAAEAAVKHRLPVPRSLLEKLVTEWVFENFKKPDKEFLEAETSYSWGIVGLQSMFGIEVLDFCNADEVDDLSRPFEIPTLIKQITGKPLPYPLVVEYDGKSMVVVGLHIETNNIHTPNRGQTLNEKDFWGYIKIADAKYFDLNN